MIIKLHFIVDWLIFAC